MNNLRFDDRIRAAVDASGLSHYGFAKEIDVCKATLSRFMSGKWGLSMASLDRLDEVLDSEVTARPRAKRERA